MKRVSIPYAKHTTIFIKRALTYQHIISEKFFQNGKDYLTAIALGKKMAVAVNMSLFFFKF